MVLPLHAAGLGQYGGGYLREPVGAAGFALGGAQTAAPAGLYTWYNPASLSLLKERQLALGLGYRPLGRTEGYLDYAFPVPPRVGMGLSFLYRGIPLISGLVDEQEYQLDDCAYSTYSFKVGISYLIRRTVTAGFNFSVLHQSLPTGYEPGGNIIYSSETAIGGFDIGLHVAPTKKLTYGLVIKNILTTFTWEFTSDFSPMYQDTLPVSVTLGQELRASLGGKPFIWYCDLAGYMLNGNFKPLPHAIAVLNNGFEWQRWDQFFVRLGIRDITMTRDLLYNRSDYYFTMAVSMGFMLDLSQALNGKDVKCNYGLATDKVGAGLDQQLDFIFAF